jgi:hypothetical protein
VKTEYKTENRKQNTNAIEEGKLCNTVKHNYLEHKIMSRCQGICEGKLGNQGDWVTCSQCKSKYCYKCAGLKQTTWKTMNDTKKAEWKCKQKCRQAGTQSDTQTEVHESEYSEKEETNENEETTQEEAEYRKRMERKLDQLIDKCDKQFAEMEFFKKTIEFLSEEQRDLKKENLDLKKSMDEAERRIQMLENKDVKYNAMEKKMSEIQKSVTDKEQYERNRNLEICQLDWLENENIPQVLENLARNFNIPFSHNEVEVAHRIPNRNKEKPSALIVQFKHRESRNRWMEQRKRIVTNDNMYRNGNRKRIYLNENMTPHMKMLFWKTKNYATQNNYRYVRFKN